VVGHLGAGFDYGLADPLDSADHGVVTSTGAGVSGLMRMRVQVPVSVSSSMISRIAIRASYFFMAIVSAFAGCAFWSSGFAAGFLSGVLLLFAGFDFGFVFCFGLFDAFGLGGGILFDVFVLCFAVGVGVLAAGVFAFASYCHGVLVGVGRGGGAWVECALVRRHRPPLGLSGHGCSRAKVTRLQAGVRGFLLLPPLFPPQCPPHVVEVTPQSPQGDTTVTSEVTPQSPLR